MLGDRKFGDFTAQDPDNAYFGRLDGAYAVRLIVCAMLAIAHSTLFGADDVVA